MKVKLLAIVAFALLLPLGIAQAAGTEPASPTDPGWVPQGGADARRGTLSAGAAAVYVDDDTYDAATCTAASHTWGTDCFDTVQGGIGAVDSGGTVYVAAGTYIETGQIVISQTLSIVGEDRATTIIKPAQDTGGSGDARGWWLAQAGYTFNLSGVTLDGQGKNVMQGIRSFGSGTVDDIVIQNISYPGYNGLAVVLFGNMTVSDSTFANIGRVGIIAFGTDCTTSVITGNTYTGKSDGDWLDYGVEVGGGAQVTISNNTITGCTGVATSDGSTSAAILVTTYFGAGTQATITGNVLTGNTGGIAVGYDSSDTSVVVAHGNSIYGNTTYGISTTAPAVDAEDNWWGSANGATHSSNTFNVGSQGEVVDDGVDFVPWLNAAPPSGVSFAPVTTTDPVGEHASIQAGADFSNPDGTVNAAAGTYVEYVTINKGLTLIGAAGATIQKPSGDVYYKLPDEGTTKSFRPIVLAYGGSITGGDGTTAATAYTIQGTGTVTVTISGFAIKANNSWTGATSSNFADGILLRNVVGTVASNTIDDMFPADANQFTLGIEVRGDKSVVTISNNLVTEFARVGILVAGNVGTPVVTVTGNTVTAVPYGGFVTNGIEINYRATGTVSGNTVTGASGEGTIWSGACIMVTDADNVTVSGNNASLCEIGIAVGGRLNYGYVALNNVIEGNILDENLYSAIEIDTNAQNTTIRNNTITGVAARGGTEEAGIVVLEYSNAASGYPNGVLIQGNSISGDPGFWGIDIYRNADNVTIQNNTITGGAVGVALELKEDNSVGKSITIGGAAGKANSFSGQTDLAVSTGPYTYSSVVYQWIPDVNASGNWWGSAHLLTVKTAANGGSLVDYTPWLAVGDDTSVDPGFQGDFSTLWVDDDSPQTGATGRVQEGANLADEEGTVRVAAGSYVEQVTINKPLTLTGSGSAVTHIVAPAFASRQTFTIPESSATFDPVVIAFGGTASAGAITGSETITLTMTGFHVNGNDDAQASRRYAGILLRNVNPGTVSYNAINGLAPAAGNAETGGIFLYGDSSATISHNNVSSHTRIGIVANGDGDDLADPTAAIQDNTVTGLGPTGAGSWAENGIQMSYGASGSIEGNTVTDHSYAGTGWWAASSIMVSDAAGSVNVEGNTIEDGQAGVYWIESSGSILDNDITITGPFAVCGPCYGEIDGVIVDPGEGSRRPPTWPVDLDEDLDVSQSEEEYLSDSPTTYTVVMNDNVLSGIASGGPYDTGGLWVIAYGTATLDFSAQRNTVRDWDVGVVFYADPTATLTVHDVMNNCIYDNNNYGAYNDTSTVFDLSFNWWGDATGPYHPTENKGGLGNAVTDYIGFKAWITDGCGGTVATGWKCFVPLVSVQ